ncbi:MAG: hypothetical protein IJ455_04070 [Agathobacter sp.]|nr:hypothetical protein [Agathobacter sp.]
MAENYTESGKVMSVYVNIKKPYEVFGTRLDAGDLERISTQFNEKVTLDNVSRVLQEHGYDGIIARNYDGTTNPIGQVIAFSSEQIKSVDNTNPTSTPDINLSLSSSTGDSSSRNDVYGSDIMLDIPLNNTPFLEHCSTQTGRFAMFHVWNSGTAPGLPSLD